MTWFISRPSSAFNSDAGQWCDNLEFHRSPKDRTRAGRLNPSNSSTWDHVRVS
jgi:hypothetical protein